MRLEAKESVCRGSGRFRAISSREYPRISSPPGENVSLSFLPTQSLGLHFVALGRAWPGVLYSLCGSAADALS